MAIPPTEGQDSVVVAAILVARHQEVLLVWCHEAVQAIPALLAPAVPEVRSAAAAAVAAAPSAAAVAAAVPALVAASAAVAADAPAVEDRAFEIEHTYTFI